MGVRNPSRKSLLHIAALLAACLSACPLLADAPTSAPDSPAVSIEQLEPTPVSLGEPWVNPTDSPMISAGDSTLTGAGELSDATLPPDATADAPAITLTPEPATTSFLALGSVILLVSAARKRRRRTRSQQVDEDSAKRQAGPGASVE